MHLLISCLMALGTTKVINWLANAARECEDVSSIVPSIQPPTRHSKQRSKKKSNSNVPQNVKISSVQMLQLAEIVSKSSKNVPFDILNTIDKVIDGRKHCAEFYAAIRSNKSEAAEDGHKHFIDVLQNTRSLLAKRCQDSSPQATKSNRKLPETQSTEDKGLRNAFAFLQIDEPSLNPLGNAPEPSKQVKKTAYELEDASDEKELAIWCLLQDFRDVRMELRNIW